MWLIDVLNDDRNAKANIKNENENFFLNRKKKYIDLIPAGKIENQEDSLEMKKKNYDTLENKKSNNNNNSTDKAKETSFEEKMPEDEEERIAMLRRKKNIKKPEKFKIWLVIRKLYF